MRTLLFSASTILLMACVNRGPRLAEPVGQTTTTDRATRTAPADSGRASKEDSHVAVESADPCGADPPIVQFDGSSTEIDEPQLQELRRMAGCLNAAPHDKNGIVLVGYTDVIGTVSANLELGLARAQVVMRHLVSSGVAPGRIVVASAGELQRPRARLGLHAPRVEVLITRGGPSRPNEPPIARGIDAEGLVRQPQTTAPATTAPPSRPSNTAQPARKR